jgi:RNA polymerase sigma factor for flagellar operon FliA
VTGQTVGRLWSQYLKARADLDRGGSAGIEKDARQRAEQLRDRLLVNYSPLVKYVAGRLSARATGTVDQGDFISWGVLGLLDAIETFDPEREVKFETYAISKIRWAILDEFRKEDPLPRRVRARAQESERVRSRLAQKLRRAPGEKEVAAEMGLEAGEYRNLLHQQSRAQVGSLEARTEDAEGYGLQLQVADESAEDPQVSAHQEELRGELITAMRNLSERERLVVALYYYEGLTLKEIGQALQLTEGRISQIMGQTLRKLRRFVTDDHLLLGNL